MNKSLDRFITKFGLRKPQNWLYILFSIAALGSVIYFIIGPQRGYFHSDYTDSIYWANASIEGKAILNPYFNYAAILPFSSNLWLIPLILIFGMNYATHTAGMVIFAIVFFASLLFLSSRLGMKGIWRMTFIVASFLLLSGSEKLREMIWGHVIYYSMSILFIVIGLGLAIDYLSGKKERITMILLAFLTIGIAMDGVQIIALTVIPIAGGILLERFFDNSAKLRDDSTKRAIKITVFLVAMTLVGLAVLSIITGFGRIRADYANAYSTYADSERWFLNVLAIPSNMLSLYVDKMAGGKSIISVETVFLFFRVAGMCIINILPFGLLLAYRKINDRVLRILVFTHAVNAGIIFFLVTFGTLGNVNWRLIPILGTAVITSIYGLKWFFEGKGLASKPENDGPKPDKTAHYAGAFSTTRKRVAMLGLSILLLSSCLTAGKLYAMPFDYGRDNTIHQLTDYLKSRDLEYGFATFWQSQAITLLSDNEVRTRCVQVDNEGVHIRTYQSDVRWYEDQSGVDRYFILLDNNEFNLVQYSSEWVDLEPIIEEVAEPTPGFKAIILRDNPWKYIDLDEGK